MTKKKKLKSIPVIHRRLYRLASEECRKNAGYKCEVCGIALGETNPSTSKPIRLDAHHIMSRDIKDTPMKWDLRNLVCLCTTHHKFGDHSAHKHSIYFSQWLMNTRLADFNWILLKDGFKCNLKNRDNLTYIEECLRMGRKINYSKLIQN